jgi:hypothetical protein
MCPANDKPSCLRRLGLGLTVSLVVLTGCTSSPPNHAPLRSPTLPRQASSTTVATALFPGSTTSSLGGYLAPGSDPSVVPADVLVADNDNNRLVVIDPGGHVVWTFPNPQSKLNGHRFLHPDDAFFTPDGQHIIVTEEDFQVVTLIDIPNNSIVWRYGVEDTPGTSPGYLSNPDDALVVGDGKVILADIKNCRILVLRIGQQRPVMSVGSHPGACLHDPPSRFGSPNGAFPLSDGNFLVTEINGSWVDEMTPTGKILWSAHLPGINYPSDSNEVFGKGGSSSGTFLTVDYSAPGQLVEFDSHGNILWRYQPADASGTLDHPSLCMAMPNPRYIICNDDYNHRVVVVDSSNSRIVWQYGHLKAPGAGPGYLNKPDGLDLAPPFSFADRYYQHVAHVSFGCAPELPPGSCSYSG